MNEFFMFHYFQKVITIFIFVNYKKADFSYITSFMLFFGLRKYFIQVKSLYLHILKNIYNEC